MSVHGHHPLPSHKIYVRVYQCFKIPHRLCGSVTCCAKFVMLYAPLVLVCLQPKVYFLKTMSNCLDDGSDTVNLILSQLVLKFLKKLVNLKYMNSVRVRINNNNYCSELISLEKE